MSGFAALLQKHVFELHPYKRHYPAVGMLVSKEKEDKQLVLFFEELETLSDEELQIGLIVAKHAVVSGCGLLVFSHRASEIAEHVEVVITERLLLCKRDS